MMKSVMIRAVFLLAVLMLVGCGGKKDSPAGGAKSGDGPIHVATTTGMIGDISRNVGGEHVSVTSLMGPGVDPHLYKATAGDITTLQNADVIFYNGLNLEGKMTEIFVQMARKNPHVVAVTESVDPSKILEPKQMAGHYDPHVWFDVTLWSEAAQKIEETFSAVLPKYAETFKKNGEAYRQQLTELHQWCLTEAAKVPPENRVLVTSHDAFNYFGRAYGFEVVGLQGISTVTEAGLADITRLSDFIKQRKVPAIFVESSVPKAAIERVSKESGARIGGELFSDAMGKEGTPEGTYIGMVRHNMTLVVTALSGS